MRNRAVKVLFLFVLSFSVLIPLISSQKTAAAIPFANKFEFIDGANIQVDLNGQVTTGTNLIDVKFSGQFVDKNPWDTELEFRSKDQKCSDSWIHLDSRAGNTGKLKIETINPYDGNKCIVVFNEEPIALGATDKNQLYLNWVDSGNIATINTGAGGIVKLGQASARSKQFNATTLVRMLGSKSSLLSATNSCDITLDITSNSNGNLKIKCLDSGPKSGIAYTNVSIGNVAAATAAAGSGTPATVAKGPNAPSCEKDGGELSWILCPVLRILSTYVQKIDEQIGELLSLPSSYYNDPQVAQAWARMRNIAYAILIPIMLVMIVATALGFEIVSAYTMKKAMPRLFIAIIFMSLSLDITKFLIILANDAGQGILGIISQAFAGASNISLASLFDPGGAAGGLFTLGVGIGVGVGLGIILILINYLFVAGLILLIAFFLLALRQMLLITFMILAPLAILAWIFPGNDKLWKLWWSSFSKLLLLFPLIMLLIGAGRGFAYLVSTTGEQGFLQTILKLTAYVVPYFFIPAAFKFAGGAFAAITGMVNDRGKGVFGRLKKGRQDGYKKAWSRAKAGQYYGKTAKDGIRNKLGRKIQTAALLPQAGLYPSEMGSNMVFARGVAEMEHRNHLLKDNGFIRSVVADDDIMKGALHGAGDFDATRKIIKDAGQGRFKNIDGSEKKEDLDLATRAAIKFRKEAGTAANLTAFYGLGTSSTAWKTEYEAEKNADGSDMKDAFGNTVYKLDGNNQRIIKGERANIKMLRDMDKALGHERFLLPNLTQEVRQGQDAAGRFDVGSSAFGQTMAANNELHELGPAPAATAPAPVKAVYEAKVTAISKKLTRSILEGKSAASAMAGKEQAARNVAEVLFEDADRALQQAATLPYDSPAQQKAQTQAIQIYAQLEGVHVAESSFSRAGGSATSDGLNGKVNTAGFSSEVIDMLTDRGKVKPEKYEEETTSFNPMTRKSTTIKVEKTRFVPDPQPLAELTRASIIENLQRTNEVMRASVKTYTEQANTAMAASQAAQQNQANINAAINAPTVQLPGAQTNPGFQAPTGFKPPGG